MTKLFNAILNFSQISFIRNSGWNLLGQAIPLLSGLLCVPNLIHNIGNERFGFLSISWMLIGYFSLFDFGIGRAITYGVAKRHAENKDFSGVFSTATVFLLIVSTTVSLITVLFSNSIVQLLKISPELLKEATESLKILALTLPFVILTIGLRGALEGLQHFKAINFAAIPHGALLFLAPMIVSFFNSSLVALISSLFAIRALNFITFLYILVKPNPHIFRHKPSWHEFKDLVRFGSWMTVTNIVSPLMVNMDRLLIGAKLSVAAVTHYTVPFDMIIKALVLPSATANALFPEFSKIVATHGDATQTKKLVNKSMKTVLVLMSPPLLFVFIFAELILKIWISEEMAVNGSTVLRILCVGVLINGLAYIPFTFIQGAGRSDMTAKAHMIEIVLYAPLMYYLTLGYGIVGTAVAWLCRVTLDLLLLISMSRKLTGAS